MNNNYTDISILLDKSGSMSSIRTDTIGGFNTFLSEQKKIDGELKVTLMQFANISHYTMQCADIKTVSELNEDNYRTDGPSTALLDSLGKLIIDNGNRLRDLPEDKRPAKVLIVVITDGLENDNHIYNKNKINEMVEHQKSKYNWDFMFIGASLDEFQAGHSYGQLSGLNSVYIGSHSTPAAFNKMSDKVVSYRGLSAASFDSQEQFTAAKLGSLSYSNSEKEELKS